MNDPTELLGGLAAMGGLPPADEAFGALGVGGEDAAAREQRLADESVPVEHLDYGYVDRCTDAAQLRAILRVLKSGREGKFEHLERHVEARMLALMPAAERGRYVAMHAEPTRADLAAAKGEVAAFLSDVERRDVVVEAAVLIVGDEHRRRAHAAVL